MQASVDAGFCFCAVDVDVGFSCVVQPIFIESNWSPVSMCVSFPGTAVAHTDAAACLASLRKF